MGIEDTDSYSTIYKNLIKIACRNHNLLGVFFQFLDTLVIATSLSVPGWTAKLPRPPHCLCTRCPFSMLPATLVFHSHFHSACGVVSPAVNDQKQADNYIFLGADIGDNRLPCAFGMFAVSRPAIA